MHEGVLLDTSFFLRFLNDSDPLFRNATDYYEYFLNRNISLYISTVSIGEYCVRGKLDELPLRNLRILPYNTNHAVRAGEMARILFEERKLGNVHFNERIIIPNDTKLFAQADQDENIKYYLTADSESIKASNFLNSRINIYFEIIDLNMKYSDFFGILDFT